MNKSNVVKKNLLYRKIKEYFSKNPKATSLIVKADVGENKTLWKVVREGKNFKVVEVNTLREEFTFEGEIPPTVREAASLEYSNLSRQFVQAMTPPFDHTKLSNVLKAANQAVGKVVDPKEKQEIGAMVGALTNLVDATTAGGGSAAQMSRSSMTTQARPITTLRQGASHPGKVVKEEEEKKEDEKKSDEKKADTKPKGKDKPHNVDKIEPKKDDADGLETNLDDKAPEEPSPTKALSAEEMVVSKTLSGQTIKAANIQLTPNGGKLSLDLVSAAVPAELEWLKTGKVVFRFNGRPYVLKRD